MQNSKTARHYFPGYVNKFQMTAGSVTVNIPMSWVAMILPSIEHSDINHALSAGTESTSGSTTSVGFNTNPLVYIRILCCPNDLPSLGSVTYGSGGAPNDTWLGYVCNRGRRVGGRVRACHRPKHLLKVFVLTTSPLAPARAVEHRWTISLRTMVRQTRFCEQSRLWSIRRAHPTSSSREPIRPPITIHFGSIQIVV